MAVIKDRVLTINLGLAINVAFMILKFVVFIYSKLNLFFADAIDSFADSFVIFLIIFFGNMASDNYSNIMFFCQWCVIIIFRVIIFLEQISDLIKPDKREQPLLIITVSVIVIAGGIVLAILFVDEDDVVKFFIDDDEKRLKKLWKKQQQSLTPKKLPLFGIKILPIFAEALDNFVTTFLALIIGILLQYNVAVDSLYLIDDIGNMCISCVMIGLACSGLWELSERYRDKSYFQPLYSVVEVEGGEERIVEYREEDESRIKLVEMENNDDGI